MIGKTISNKKPPKCRREKERGLIMRKIIQKLEAYLHRTLLEMKKMEAEIEALKSQEEMQSGIEKSRTISKRKRLQENLESMRQKYAVVFCMNESITFTGCLFKSFKHKWVPMVAMAVPLIGQLSGIIDFVLSTAINVAVFWAIMSVLMYAMHERWLPKVRWEEKDSEAVKYSKGILLLAAVIKLLLSFLGPVLMYVVIVLLAIVIALCIAKDDIKVLIERWKKK